ncbi:chromosome segregation protein [Variovorax boronicumulans]|uniref:SbcC/MukB-like Walker B domain-containing protein n=1 Tax=Variovorax boronicumulans TaxID=436515 RepID=UPI0024742A62|nr:SbcC/MukB-like Walker B domain-containing protein [Variovorax boronicumulans]MDH6167122.1 chromosome segregation protein [Variovorax boronicumulans]
MKKLVYIRVVQFFLYEKREVVVGMNCGIFGANGSGKSSLLDAVQIVMLGANASRGNAGVSFNAQADEGGHNTRSVRSYCLGQYGDSPDARVRDSATTYITLVWNDTVTQEILSTGVCIAASGDRDSHDVLGRFIIPVDLTLNDHLESADGKERPRSWGSFRQMLLHRAHGEEVLFHDSERLVNAMLFRLRGARGAPRLDAYRQAFRFGLRMKFDKSVDDIVRQQVLEARPTNIKRFKDVLHTFQEMAALVRSVQIKLDEADLIEADFADAHRRYCHSISLASLAQDAELEVANEAVTSAEQDEGNAADRLEAADKKQKQAGRDVEQADLHAKECASVRDKHASHADAELIREQLDAAQERLTDQRAGLHRSISAIGRAIDQKIPGKLVADSSEAAGLALKEINTLLASGKAASRDAVETTIRRGLRAAKLVSDELLADMQALGREQNSVQNELDGMRENQDRVSKGKPPLDQPARDLRRELADVGIDAMPVCDLVRVDELDWQPAIESYLGGSNMQALLVDERDERKAFGIYRRARIYEAKVVMTSKFAGRGSPKRGTIAELISGNSIAAVNYLRSKFGDTQRAETEEECFAHRFAMTKDGMRLADGEIVRKRPTKPIDFKIGPTSAATRSSITESIRQLEVRKEELAKVYGRVKALLQSLGPFIGGEQEKVRELLDHFDRVAKDAETEQMLSRQLESLDTEEYRLLVQAAGEADAALVMLRDAEKQAIQDFGSAKSEHEQKQIETAKRRAWTQTQKEIAQRSRAQDGYDADFAAEQWEKLLDRQGTSFLAIAADCGRRSKAADDESRRKASSGVQKLGGFLIKHNEFLPSESRDDWRLSRTWLTDRVSVLRDTGLREYKARMEDALSAAKSTFRNDVAVALNEHLEWLGDTVDRMNQALRAAPTFTNGERYQFRRHARPAYAALLKFIKDVAQFGPTDDMFGGAGVIPKEFEDLMREKTVVGAAAVKSPLDDYREFFDFDVEVFREDAGTGAGKHVGWLSKRVGSGSGGEHRAPLYVIAGAAMSSAYRLERGDDTGMRLLVIDEAFIKMDPRNIVATMRYFEELGLQIFMASTGDALGTLTAFLDRYYDIMRDAESNVVLLEGHDISASLREMFRADLPEFNPDLITQEIARQFQPQSPPAEGVAA